MSISASRIVNVIPRAINAGASELEIVGLLLTTNSMCPYPATKVFGSASDVGSYFGLDSREYEVSQGYFLGYTNSFKKPRKLVFGRLVTNAIAATMVGTGTVASLNTLQTITDGACVLRVDGVQKTIFHPSLSDQTSLSGIAEALTSSLGVGTFTYNSTLGHFVLTSNSTGSTSTLEVVADGGDVTVVKRYALTTTAATTFEMRSKGLYNLGTETLVATWDEVWSKWDTEPEKYSQYFEEDAENGELRQFTYYDKTGLLYGNDITCTEVLSNIGLSSYEYWAGSNALTPSANMEGIIALNQNWVSFTTLDEVDDDIKVGLATWCNSKNCEYLYCPYTTKVKDVTIGNADGLIYKLKAFEGGLLTYGSVEYAAFIMAQGASIDWDRVNGLNTYCFKQQSGLTATVEDNNTAAACEELGVNYYGNFATRNDEFVFYYEGKMFEGSAYGFVDAYIGQVWLRNVLQVAIVNGLTQAGRVPYTEEGYSMIRAWCQDPINRALKNGAIEPGVAMSEAQKAQVISEVGSDVTGQIYLNGFYLLIEDPPAATRAERGTPTMGLWYGYGGSVHRVELPTTVIL